MPGDGKEETVSALEFLSVAALQETKQQSDKDNECSVVTTGLRTSRRQPTGSASSDTFPCLGQVGGWVFREGFLKMEINSEAKSNPRILVAKRSNNGTSRSFSEGKERKLIASLRLTTPHRQQFIQLLDSQALCLYILERRVFSLTVCPLLLRLAWM